MDSANINQTNPFESTPSLSSSIILEDVDMSDSMCVDNKVDVLLGVGSGLEHPPPPTDLSISMMLDPTPPSAPQQDQDMMDEDGDWTIIGPGTSTSAGSDTTTRPASVSATGSVHDLTASNVLRLDVENGGGTSSPPSATSPPKRSHTRATDMSPPDLSEAYCPVAACDPDGLCGIGAWADMATPGILAKKRRITLRQMMK